MGNPISKSLKIGTIGELLVQLKLLQYNVQAAPPVKDTGNDLIAIKGTIFKAIQVKASGTDNIRTKKLPKIYHILALVYLRGEDNQIRLDDSKIFLLSKKEVTRKSYNVNKLKDTQLINKTRVNDLFS